ncbi:pantetheinase [Parasteatoda tepidariorum]|uniref:pantetheinase n=1 Tax=Parasteatoda tepidariorum TaxID=114398 RepID=UPI00077F96AD|nr:pantetheinase isoform X2 [Parasteatoda tepidariorum]XP_015929208.1 pantetheinase isoform X2 [Parasteatoda tepidariorum]XP_042898946.1 pantetheinase isoform X2 [Parasteatoda tepidariorum]
MGIRITVLSIIIYLSVSGIDAASRPFTAAAYDHARFGRLDDPPVRVLEVNLKKYIQAAEIASSKGADIIVYPEYGLFYPGDRSQLKSFLEDIPDPKKFQANPCDEKDYYLKKPILYTLSCIARNNSIVVVANTGDIKNCTGESECPEDGVFHYNTNVVFDRNGTLILRYYKEHLFFELGMDLPKEQQDPTFTTDFGTFATYICFDIIFERMSQVAKWPQVDGIMFSTMWFENPPQYVSVPLWQGWALGNNATIVVSNVQSPSLYAVGSGIFHKKFGSLGYTYSPDSVSKVVVAEVPAEGEPISNTSLIAFTDTKIWDWVDDGEDVPKICSNLIINDTDHFSGKFYCFDEKTSNYTLTKLVDPSGQIEACNNGMCCSLNYTAESMEEEFYLGVYNGTLNSFNRYHWCEESCFVARCDSIDGQPCSTFPRRASTIFKHVDLKSNFSTEFIYPSVVSSKSRLVPKNEWEFDVTHRSAYESSIHFHSTTGKNLLSVGFKARCYNRDPPYVR